MATSTEERIARYLAAHPGATRQEARGHGKTGEHGVTKVALSNGETGFSFRDEKFADRAIRAAEREGFEDRDRVKVALVNKDGSALNLWQGKGFSFGGLKSFQAGAGSFGDALRGMVAGSRYEAEVEEALDSEDFGEFQFYFE